MLYGETIQSERLYSKGAKSYEQVFERAILAEGRLTAIVEDFMDGKDVLDLACGNGRWLRRFSPGSYVGVDLNESMLDEARHLFPHHTFVQADMANLPFADNSFDWAISVATYHHLHSDRLRKLALAELERVLKPGGEAFITVWNRRQPRFWVSRHDVEVPWRTGNKILYRYYHLFTYAELEKLVRNSGLQVIKSFPEHAYRFPVKTFSRNICLLVKKGI